MTKAKALALLLPFFCIFLLLPFSDPDTAWPALKFAGVFFLCLISAGSCLGLGFGIAKKAGLPALAAAPLGSLCLASVLFLSGMAGGWGSQAWFFYVAPLGAGLWLLPEALREIKLPTPLGAVLGLMLLLALAPSAHPDPLYYNWLGARVWYDSGGIRFFPSDPLLFLSGLWDSLYVWPIAWLKLAPGEELIAQQIAGQFLAASLAGGGLLLLLRDYASRFAEKSALVVFAIACPVMLAVSFTAKNDWGILLWLVAGAWLFERKRFFWSGALFAAAAATKWTSLFFPVFILLFFWRQIGPKDLIRFCLGFIPFGALILWRNFIFTGAPLFPHFAVTHLSGADAELFRELGFQASRLSLGTIGENLIRLFAAQPASFGCLLLPIIWENFPEWRTRLTAWFGLLLFFTLLLAAALHPMLSWRVVSPLPMLWTASGAWVAILATRRLMPNRAALASSAAAGLAFLHAISPAWPQLANLLRQPGATIRDFEGGEAMAFLRLQPKVEPAAIGGNPQLFYLSHLPAQIPESSLDMESLLRGQTKPGRFALLLREKGVRWFLETKAPVPLGLGAALISVLAEKYPASVAYTGRNSRVIDLETLEPMLKAPSFSEPDAGILESRIPEQK